MLHNTDNDEAEGHGCGSFAGAFGLEGFSPALGRLSKGLTSDRFSEGSVADWKMRHEG